MEKITALTESIPIDIEFAQQKETKGCIINAVIMARLIAHDLHVAKDKAGNLYFYDNGVYRPQGEIAVAEMYRRHLKLRLEEEEWKSSRRDEIIKCMIDDAPYILTKPDLYRINLLNGIYDWSSQEFVPSDPSYRTTIQIPINYNPDATCSYWDQFFYQLFPEGVNLLYEIIALFMIPFMDLQKCVILVGEGSNGKSAYLKAIETAIGKDNICSISLHKLTSNNERFYTAGLMGKLVNAFGDLSPKDIEDTANFKALTGEDTVTIEFKGKQPFSYSSFCRLIFSCNKPISSADDTSRGYARRFLNIPFMKTFSVNPAKGQEIKENLSDPNQLSGLFNKLIPMFDTVTDQGFTWTDELAAMVDNYCPIPESTRLWIKAHVTEDPNGFLPSSAFYDWHTARCPAVEPFERTKLVTYMKNIFPSVKANHSVRVWSGEPPIKCYKGVRLINQQSQIDVVELAWKTRRPERDDVPV